MRTHSTSQFHEDDLDEPIGEYLLKPWGWLAAVVILAVVSAAQLGDMPDASGEWPQSTALEQAQQDERDLAHREAAAQALCNEEQGPQAMAVWVSENTVQCVNKRGVPLSTSTMGAAHASQ